MKTQEKAEKYAEGYRCPPTNENEYCKHDIISAYNNAYTQCQKDIFNELNEWIVITLSAESKLGASDNVIEALLNVKYKIESLNKQD